MMTVNGWRKVSVKDERWKAQPKMFVFPESRTQPKFVTVLESSFSRVEYTQAERKKTIYLSVYLHTSSIN